MIHRDTEIWSLIRELAGTEFALEDLDRWASNAPENLIAKSATIGASVRLGRRNLILPGACVLGNVEIGDNNIVSAHVTIGLPSRQRMQHEESAKELLVQGRIEIGNSNIFEESVSVHLPMGEITRIANGSAIGATTHVAHDCHVGDHVVIAAGSLIGGYCWIDEYANLGLGVRVHPRTAIGAHAMCGAGAVILKHVCPGAMVAGVPARYLGPNLRGLARTGLGKNVIRSVSKYLADGSCSTPWIADRAERLNAAAQVSGRDKGRIPGGGRQRK